MTAELKRQMGEISRSSEFFSVSELTAQTGQPKEKFAAVCVKELLDNAIDAAESVPLPEAGLDVTMDGDSDVVCIIVSDNGPGFKSEDIERITKFDVRVSDKLFYRSPSRGQQGNALKTVLGMPFALGSTAPVIIRSQGIEHRIYAAPDPLGQIHVDHTQTKINGLKGTVIEVTLPRNPATISFNAREMARTYALANPHVLIKFHMTYPDNSDDSKIIEISDLYQPTCQISRRWHKFMVNDLTAPSWYDVATFERNLFVYKVAQPEMTLRDYVKTFRGLSHNDKSKAVCDLFPDIKHLSDFKNQDPRVSDLLKIMNETAEPPSPKVLGIIGKEHFKTKFTEWYGITADRFFYKHMECVHDGIPYQIEAASAEVNCDRGQIFHLVNFGVAFDDPLSNTMLAAEKFGIQGFDNFMVACHADPHARDWEMARQNVAIALHITSPRLVVLDRGKTHVDIPAQVASQIANCLWAVGKSFYVEGERLKQDAAKEARRRQKREKELRTHVKEDPLKLIVYSVLRLAYLLKSANEKYWLSLRDFYYGVRDAIQKYTSDELAYSYFADLVVKYQQEYGKFKMLYYDPRGYLIEPALVTRRTKILPENTFQETLQRSIMTNLGTRDVEQYEFPKLMYNKILCVEKKGFIEPFLQAQIPQRYDMAIVASEGYTTEAIRTLFQNAGNGTDYKLFVMHDADASGYDIARTMREETSRMPGYRVDVVDLGLKLEEALDMGLQTESYTRSKALPEKLIPQLTPKELEFFTGKSLGKVGKVGKNGARKEVWKCQRIELNALGPAERIAFLERKLKEHGAANKVCPPDDVLDKYAATTFETKFRDKTREKLEKQFKIDELVEKAVAEMEIPDWSDTIDDLKERLNSNPPINWSELLDNLVTAEAEVEA